VYSVSGDIEKVMSIEPVHTWKINISDTPFILKCSMYPGINYRICFECGVNVSQRMGNITALNVSWANSFFSVV
jgi:hypothetical protein